jgi:hypothetical protein
MATIFFTGLHAQYSLIKHILWSDCNGNSSSCICSCNGCGRCNSKVFLAVIKIELIVAVMAIVVVKARFCSCNGNRNSCSCYGYRNSLVVMAIEVVIAVFL